MDGTRELELERLQIPQGTVVADESARRTLSAAGREIATLGAIAGAAAARAVEAALEVTRLERGFVFVAVDDVHGELAGESLRPLAARSLRRLATGPVWADVKNPEFCVNRTVVARALAAGRLVLVRDALLPPSPGAESVERVVLCAPFDLTHRERGIIYLDCGPSGGGPGESELAAFGEFVERCLPLVGRAWALEELTRRSSPGDAPARDEDGGAQADDDDDDVEAEVPEIVEYHGLVGSGEKLRKIVQIVEKIKDNDLNICVVGESGTGKELLGRAIHAAGNRRGGQFVGENCGAITETLLESELFGHVKGAFTGAEEDRKGLFELANGGTLFLDEIGDMSEAMQRKLLRVLQEGVIRPIGSKDTVRVDVRVISASNRDLKSLVEKGTFRADLYYRLNVITVELPPLRDRPTDIPMLIEKFAKEIREEEGVCRRFGESALRALREYPWPGNVRELRNVVRRVFLTAPRRVIARKDVAEFLSSSGPVAHASENIRREDGQIVLRIPERDSFGEIIDECERVVLQHSLDACAWNKSKVTKVLRIPRQSLYNKIAKHDLRRDWGEER